MANHARWHAGQWSARDDEVFKLSASDASFVADAIDVAVADTLVKEKSRANVYRIPKGCGYIISFLLDHATAVFGVTFCYLIVAVESVT